MLENASDELLARVEQRMYSLVGFVGIVNVVLVLGLLLVAIWQTSWQWAATAGVLFVALSLLMGLLFATLDDVKKQRQLRSRAVFLKKLNG